MIKKFKIICLFSSSLEIKTGFSVTDSGEPKEETFSRKIQDIFFGSYFRFQTESYLIQFLFRKNLVD